MLSGLFEGQVQANIYGLMYGSFACIGYSIVTIINMRIKGIDPLDKNSSVICFIFNCFTICFIWK